jgi:hypothetical protein
VSLDERARRKASRRVIPFRFLIYVAHDNPESADWLEPAERAFLVAEVARERELREAAGGHGLRTPSQAGRCGSCR